MKRKKFNPTRIKCNTCSDIIQSQYPGHWVCCKCHISSSREWKAFKAVHELTYPEKDTSQVDRDYYWAMCKEINTGCYIDSTEDYERFGGGPFSIVEKEK